MMVKDVAARVVVGDAVVVVVAVVTVTVNVVGAVGTRTAVGWRGADVVDVDVG